MDITEGVVLCHVDDHRVHLHEQVGGLSLSRRPPVVEGNADCDALLAAGSDEVGDDGSGHHPERRHVLREGAHARMPGGPFDDTAL